MAKDDVVVVGLGEVGRPLFELIQEEVQRRTARKARRDRTDEREQRDE